MSNEIHGGEDRGFDDETLRSAVDVGRFFRLAGNDAEGLVRMTGEYIAETRKMSESWAKMLEAGSCSDVSEQLHYCKGGAGIFGFMRILALIVVLEKESAFAAGAYDAKTFEHELVLAECAVKALAGGRLR
jgi:hypothetical protein